MTSFRVALFALGVASAAPAAAQQATTKPAPPPAPTPAVNTSQPAGSTIRCKDGTWAPAGAASSACDTHRGLAYRLPVITPPPAAKTRPDAGIAKAAPPPAPQGISAPEATSSPLRSTTSATAGAIAGSPLLPVPPAPPADASLLCMDGTYLTGAAEPSRCGAYGGLTAILPKKRP